LTGVGAVARARPDAAAVVTLRGTVDFASLDERGRRVAGALISGGLRPRDRVALLARNRPEWLEISSGTLRAGMVPVPVNPLLTPPEASYVIEDSGARWLFTDTPIDVHPAPERIVTFGDAYERLLHDAGPANVADVALGRPMHYTSGTTGVPKGVWVPPAPRQRAATRSNDFCRLWGINSEDVHLVCSPLSHSAPHRYALRTLEAGGTVILQDHFDAAETLAAIELFGATSTFMVPTHLERILGLDEITLARHDLTSVRLLAHAGAPIREETKRRALDVFPPGSVWEFYGATENQITRISSTEWLQKPGSVGKAPRGAEIVVTGEHGDPLPRGDTGEVWVRDPATDRFEYWGDDEKTKAAWRDGAFTVGDLGYLDEDDYLFLTGRKHDTIITGGVNVYPQEVERVLLTHPAVAEVVVYGSEHPEWGQEVRAMVVPAPEQPLEPELLRTWARDRLAGFKCPRRIEVVAELPRTSTGKLLRGPPPAHTEQV
jgi:long-chain acyl-CoA synthetase